jgi:pSer/pThr/pTyr-binding forkhead associated (FHA) protein
VAGADGKNRKSGGEEPTLTTAAGPITSGLVAAVRLARLEQLRGPGAPRDYHLAHAVTVIGRSEGADISIASPTLSRRHLEIRKTDSGVRVEDQGSSNGMFLNGTKAHAATLYEGDTIQIGDVVLVFREGQ